MQRPVWRRDATQIIWGWYGRPWSFVFHRERWTYTIVSFSAPILGDCHVTYNGREWLSHVNRGQFTKMDQPPHRRLEWSRRSWLEIDRLEAKNEQRARR